MEELLKLEESFKSTTHEVNGEVAATMGIGICNPACEGISQSCGACQTGCQSSCQNSCQTTCEISCQSFCERSCQSTCENYCQTACEKGCQATCEIIYQ